MRFVDPYTTAEDKISSLQHWILVHSCIYYKLDTNLVKDHVFDANCEQLVDLQNKYKKENKKSRYYYAFIDFDGSTGEYLIHELTPEDYNSILRKAIYLVNKFGSD